LNGYDPQRTIALVDDIRESLAASAGVQSVSAAVIAIFTDSNSSANATMEGYQAGEDEDVDIAQNWVGPDYFTTVGIPLLRGREFTRADNAKSGKVAIINETMAQRFFPDGNAVGKKFAFGSGKGVKLDIEIVGVVKDSKHGSARDNQRPFAYIPYAQRKDLGSVTFYLRASESLAVMAPVLRREVQKRDSNLPIFELKLLQQQVDESLFPDRMLTVLSICFGFLAATLAAIGLYGLMAYTVTRRTREIGIRMALGATRNNISWLILKEILLMLVVGMLIGLPAAFIIGRLTESLLFGVSASDPFVFIMAVTILATMALMGGIIPTRKATKVDPMVALRYQ
jgi:predicted permease